ncbi:hypothetical protein N866_01680 [Actinotalea ferrariae CF5-4]|uniref:Uncharacterized protein n=1 Tax=Actinotalea ferrariae CF5-4 TaxID=948458 RepID=A0A021VW20_9CELL|nr:DUF6507 family protein [Actinotalea ferrariae]EYR63282.1 hypothetical protein N866_01680 [Actinotalea ferrariae CF5-4]
MSGWRITPQGVQDVLQRVGATAAVLDAAVVGLPAKAEQAVAGTGQNPIIADALIGFFEHHATTLESIGNRINASVTGAAAATTAYVQGDEQMAAEHQAAAAQVAGTGRVRPAGARGPVVAQ